MYSIFVLLLVSQLHAGELAPVQGIKAHSEMPLARELAACKPQILPPGDSEEATARKLAEAAGLSKEELLARLIYSEALSTGFWNDRCQASSDKDIMNAIGWGIMTRVKSRARQSLDAYSDVIFGKMQFRTSFSGKKENPFASAFLCPLKSQSYLDKATKKESAAFLFKQAQSIAHAIVEKYERVGIPEAYRGITNFFYPHSEFFGDKRPSWAPHKEPKLNSGYLKILDVKTNPCVEFYSLK